MMLILLLLEKAARNNQHIFVPENSVEAVKAAKIKKPRFNVIRMDRSEFLCTKALEEVVSNCKFAANGSCVNWLQICWLYFKKGEPFTIKFKHTFNEIVDFHETDVKQKEEKGKRGKKGKPKKGLLLETLLGVMHNNLYPNCRPISVSKKNDMLDLLPYIPPIHHGYFRTLTVAVATRSSNACETQDDDNNEFIFE